MSRVIVSTKRVYMIWKCPANLLSVEDNSKTEFGEPWTWELFRDTLTYYDQNKEKHEVGVTVDTEPDYKRHEDVDFDWPENWCLESDEEEESEEESESPP